MRTTAALFFIGFIALALVTTACSKIGITSQPQNISDLAVSADAANLAVNAPPTIATLDDVPVSTDVPQ